MAVHTARMAQHFVHLQVELLAFAPRVRALRGRRRGQKSTAKNQRRNPQSSAVRVHRFSWGRRAGAWLPTMIFRGRRARGDRERVCQKGIHGGYSCITAVTAE